MGTMLGSFWRQVTSKPKLPPPNVRFDGKTAIVTGSNVGIGLEASKEMAAHGLSRVILGVRSVWELDLNSFASAAAFGARSRELDRLDIVILNAGIKTMEFTRAGTGHESNVQVNLLGTALLSLLLLEPLKQTAKNVGSPSRLTVVASEVHFWAPFNEARAPSILQRLDEEDSFNKQNLIERYNTSKLLGVLWTRELASGWTPSPWSSTLNPGIVASSLHRSDPTPGLGVMLKLLAWSPEMGGHTLTNAVAYHAEHQGAYLSEQRVTSPSPFVLSEDGNKAQKKLWDETLTVFAKEAPGFDPAMVPQWLSS
ncbi:hypothetical protein SLS62_001032 [Diatrype stigma]|uniref:Uncharacterized protein n=1 Tax=Diatrype stigma TaxID=117547 RepID=A0AAN9V003_9PEZI